MSNLHSTLMSEAEKIRQHTFEMAQMLIQEDGLSVDEALDRVMDETDPCDLLALVYAYGDTNDIWNAYTETARDDFEGAIAEELRAMNEKDED